MNIKMKIALGVVGGLITIVSAALIRNALRDNFTIYSAYNNGRSTHISFSKKISAGKFGLVSVMAYASIIYLDDTTAYLAYWSDGAQYNLNLTESEVRLILDYLVDYKFLTDYSELSELDNVWNFKYRPGII